MIYLVTYLMLVLLSYAVQLLWIQWKEKFIERQDFSSAAIVSFLWPVLVVLVILEALSTLYKKIFKS